MSRTTGSVARRKSLASTAGNAIGGVAIAATRLMVRKARTAVRSADQALYGHPSRRKRAKTKVVRPRGRSGKRAGRKVTRKAAPRARGMTHRAIKRTARA